MQIYYFQKMFEINKLYKIRSKKNNKKNYINFFLKLTKKQNIKQKYYFINMSTWKGLFSKSEETKEPNIEELKETIELLKEDNERLILLNLQKL